MIFQAWLLKRPGVSCKKREKSCKMWDFVPQRNILGWQVCSKICCFSFACYVPSELKRVVATKEK